MKAGIVGLPNVGKSTLFNCLSNTKAQSANFPFCTIDPNIGLVNIPDERLNKLVELVAPEKIVHSIRPMLTHPQASNNEPCFNIKCERLLQP